MSVPIRSFAYFRLMYIRYNITYQSHFIFIIQLTQRIRILFKEYYYYDMTIMLNPCLQSVLARGERKKIKLHRLFTEVNINVIIILLEKKKQKIITE